MWTWRTPWSANGTLGLELMAIVGPHLANPEGESGNDVVDEGDRIGLGVLVVDLERSDAGVIINGGVLVALDRFAVFSLKGQELDVDLDLVTGNLLPIVMGVILRTRVPRGSLFKPWRLRMR